MEIDSEIKDAELAQNHPHREILTEREFRLLISATESVSEIVEDEKDIDFEKQDNVNDSLPLPEGDITEMKDIYALFSVFDDAIEYRKMTKES